MAIIPKLTYLTSFTQSEKMLADYILSHQNEAIHLSSRELAAKSYTSVSTVYRVCDKLGLNGFNELKLLLAREKEKPSLQPLDYDAPFSMNATDYEIMDSMKNLYLQTVEETQSLLDLQDVHKAVVLLDEAKVVNIYTAENNRASAIAFATKMQRAGRRVQVLCGVYEQQMESIHSIPGTVAIILSYAGRNQELKSIVPFLKKQNTRIILISSLLDQSFEKYADVHLYLCSRESTAYTKIMTAYSLTISSSYVFDVLYSILYRRNADDFQQEIGREFEGIRQIMDV